ncbi:hypothetical protein BH23THE1_BH23THE1_27250 [soil metagenome]
MPIIVSKDYQFLHLLLTNLKFYMVLGKENPGTRSMSPIYSLAPTCVMHFMPAP